MGWQRDEDIARRGAAELGRVLARIPVGLLAREWLALSKTAALDDVEEFDTSGSVDDGPQRAKHWLTDWLHRHKISLGALVLYALTALYTEGYLVGHTSAESAVTGKPPHWGWTPGDADAAADILARTGHQHDLDAFLGSVSAVLATVADNRIDALAKALAEALASGASPEDLTRILRGLLGGDWADMVAANETARAVNDAALQRYDTARLDGVTALEWVTAASACPICLRNAAAGPVPLGQPFPSGALSPPQHPHCRCAVFPART